MNYEIDDFRNTIYCTECLVKMMLIGATQDDVDIYECPCCNNIIEHTWWETM